MSDNPPRMDYRQHRRARRLSPQNPTGESTVPTAPPKYAAARKPSDSVNATNFLRI